MKLARQSFALIMLFVAFATSKAIAQQPTRAYRISDSAKSLSYIKFLNSEITQTNLITNKSEENKNRSSQNYNASSQLLKATNRNSNVAMTGQPCTALSSRTLVSDDGSNLNPQFITKARDGNILLPATLVDYTGSTPYERALITKTTEQGYTIWSKKMQTDYPGGCPFYRVLEADDNNLYAFGYLAVPADSIGGNNTELLVAKLTANGSMIWTKTYRCNQFSANYNSSVDIYQIATDAKGNIYLTGTLRNNMPAGAIVIKLDDAGNILWDKAFMPGLSNPVLTYGYGISLVDDDLILYGKIDYGFYNDATFLVRMKQLTGETISTKAYAPEGPNTQFSTWANNVYLTKLKNGNVALAGRLFHDTFLNSAGITRYVGMIEFTPDGSFVKGYQVTGSYTTNGYATRITVHDDGSADYSFLNYDNRITGLNVIFGNMKDGQILKERILNYTQLGAGGSYNFVKLSDGGSLTIEQNLDVNQHGEAEFIQLHNSDVATNTCVGRDTNMVTILDLNYGPVDGLQFEEEANTMSETFRISITSVDEPLQITNNCNQTSFCKDLKMKISEPNICTGTPVNVSYAKNIECGSRLLWGYDNGAIETAKAINDSTMQLVFNKPWSGYIHGVLPACSAIEDSVLLNVFSSPGKVDLGRDTLLCAGKAYTLHAKSGYLSYLWQDGSTDSTFIAKAPGQYYVSVSDFCGSSLGDTIIISPARNISFNFSQIYSKCPNERIDITTPSGLNTISFSPSSNISYSDEVIETWGSNNTDYLIEATTSDGCSIKDSLKVKVYPMQSFSLGTDTTVCEGAVLDLKAPDGFSTYNWSDGSTAQYYSAGVSGAYWLTATDDNDCSYSDTLNLIINKLPDVTLGNDLAICPGTKITLKASNTLSSSYAWQDGSTDNEYVADTPGEYWLRVTDENGCINADTLLITGYSKKPENFLNKADSICSFEGGKINAKGRWATYQWNNGSTSSYLSVSSPGSYWLKVSNNEGCYASDTIQIFAKNCIEGIYFPSAFTPNQDGKNDIYKPIVHMPVEKFYFVIFNRFGQKIFETRDSKKGWDGTFNAVAVPNATSFIWYCTYKLPGEKEKNEKGTVVVLR